MLPSASVLAYRREERVQKAFSGDHHGHGDARLRARATPAQGRKMRLCGFESSEALAEQPAVARSAVELHRC
eukprot:scaffold18384_cov37-Phaeocystis_antarctica.AAC.1